MIIYNITTKLEKQIADEWLQWMLNEHINEILQTKCFLDFKLVRLLDVDDSEGPTYAVQYFAESKADYNRYIQLYSSEVRKRSFDRWGDKFISFRSVMEVVK
jgi:hypothetical protein